MIEVIHEGRQNGLGFCTQNTTYSILEQLAVNNYKIVTHGNLVLTNCEEFNP
jgi:hypothetical protein